jgi:intergrase/recombinase
MTPEERLRDDLRMEVTKAKEECDRTKEDCRKEIEALRAQLKEKDKMIEKFEMFIDICNQRVMVQRERLTSDEGPAGGGGGAA